jgi:hypothetical protein
LQKTGDGALYDYYEFIQEKDPVRYQKLRELYVQELKQAIDIAEKMKKANIPNYIDLLTITPVRQWSNLEKIYVNPKLSEIQKFEQSLRLLFEESVRIGKATEADMRNHVGNFTYDALSSFTNTAILGTLGVL